MKKMHSDDKVAQIPTQANLSIKDFLFAPVEPSWFIICVDGKRMPKMLGRRNGDQYEILFDDRWIYVFDSIESAYTACKMAANALAIGQGYAWSGAESKDQPFAPTIMGTEEG